MASRSERRWCDGGRLHAEVRRASVGLVQVRYFRRKLSLRNEKRSAALLRRLVRFDGLDDLTRCRRYHIYYGFATAVRKSRLERPGIGPGAERCVRSSVDTIEAPQPVSFTRLEPRGKSVGNKQEGMTMGEVTAEGCRSS